MKRSPPLPAAMFGRAIGRLFCAARPERPKAHLRSFRGRAGAEIGETKHCGLQMRQREGRMRSDQTFLEGLHQKAKEKLAKATDSAAYFSADHPAFIFQVVGQSRDDAPTVVSGGKPSSRLAVGQADHTEKHRAHSVYSASQLFMSIWAPTVI